MRWFFVVVFVASCGSSARVGVESTNQTIQPERRTRQAVVGPSVLVHSVAARKYIQAGDWRGAFRAVSRICYDERDMGSCQPLVREFHRAFPKHTRSLAFIVEPGCRDSAEWEHCLEIASTLGEVDSYARDRIADATCAQNFAACPRAAALASPTIGEKLIARASVVRPECRLGRAERCQEEANLWVEQYPKYAAALYEESCNDGAGDACLRVGRIYLHGIRLGKDLDRAGEFFRKACDADSGGGCYELGKLHRTGRGAVVMQSAEEAHRLFARGCDLGSMAACDEVSR